MENDEYIQNYYPIKEAASLAGISEEVIEEMIKSKRIQYFDFNGYVRIREDQVMVCKLIRESLIDRND